VGVVSQLPANNPASGVSAASKAHEKVTLCHRTDSDTNPYVVITVDIASAGEARTAEGHNSHNGPVWSAGLKAAHIKWGDIIPAYTFGSFSYPGKNLTAAGQAILDNGCKIPGKPSPSPSPSPTPSHRTPSSPGNTGAYWG
jgi:hypothetical protein